MSKKGFLHSSIGKKFVMGLTGLFLISFLVIHVSLNSAIFLNDNGATFNAGAEFMAHNPVIRVLEIGLFAGLLLHIIQGLILWWQNVKARPVKYVVNKPRANSKWYSRSMGLLGTLILLFLVMHLYHFWLPSRFGGMANVQVLETTTLGDYANQETHNLYKAMLTVFQDLWVVIIYVLGVISLFWHLLHGFQSAFQTFGLNHKKYSPIIKGFGFTFSLVICLLFAAMPISIYAGWIN